MTYIDRVSLTLYIRAPDTLGSSSPTPSRQKIQRVCTCLKDGPSRNWGGHAHPSPPRGDASEYDNIQAAGQ